MSNNLPPGAIPKLYRLRNKSGGEIGAWYVKIQQKPVNLRTQDYMKARERAKEALGGKREFMDDRFFNDSLPGQQPPPAQGAASPNPAPPGDWTADATRAAQATTTSGEEPKPEYFPPGVTPEQPTPPPESPKPGIGAESTTLPPEMLDGLIKQIAQTVVELQIQGQEYLAIRWGKFQPGTVAPDSKARQLPQAIWEEQIRKWIPPDLPLPAWVVAPVLCAMLTVPIQLEGATPLKPPDIQPKQ